MWQGRTLRGRGGGVVATSRGYTMLYQRLRVFVLFLIPQGL